MNNLGLTEAEVQTIAISCGFIDGKWRALYKYLAQTMDRPENSDVVFAASGNFKDWDTWYTVFIETTLLTFVVGKPFPDPLGEPYTLQGPNPAQLFLPFLKSLEQAILKKQGRLPAPLEVQETKPEPRPAVRIATRMRNPGAETWEIIFLYFATPPSLLEFTTKFVEIYNLEPDRSITMIRVSTPSGMARVMINTPQQDWDWGAVLGAVQGDDGFVDVHIAPEGEQSVSSK